MCKFSVVIPVYNRRELLRRALDSVFSQDFTDYEVIIVDDCSVEDIEGVVHSYASEKVKYIRNKSNLGGGASRNVGVEHSSGQYICFLDSDDYWKSQKLSTLESYISSNPNAAIFIGNSIVEKANGVHRKPISSAEKYEDFLSLIVIGDNLLQTSALAIRKDILTEIKFDSELPRYQDLDLYVKLARYYRNTVWIPSFLSVWDVSHEQSSITKSNSLTWSLAWAKSYRSLIGDACYYQFVLKYIYARDVTGFSGLDVCLSGVRSNELNFRDLIKFSAFKIYRMVNERF